MTAQTPHSEVRADKPLVIVTGGTGLLGLIERLLPQYRIVNLDLDGDAESDPAVEFIPSSDMTWLPPSSRA